MKSHIVTAALLFGFLAGCTGLELNEGSVRVGAPKDILTGEVTNAVFRIDPAGGADRPSIITKDEDFQITLLSGYICDFRESGILDFGLTSNAESEKCDAGKFAIDVQGRATRGEIAILAGFQFRGTTANQPDTPEERLVYFNDDVRESGQLYNFKNLPVYGPAPYRDASARLRITILEIDQEEVEKQAAFLETVASAGATFASPAQGAVLGVLSKIGDALIKSNKDDREFAFDLGFDPDNDQSKVHRILLREGYLVLMRRETRSDKDHFDGIQVCPTRGVIVKAPQDCMGNDYYSDATWLLLRISRERTEVVDATITQTLADVLKTRDPLIEAATIDGLKSSIEKLRPKKKN